MKWGGGAVCDNTTRDKKEQTQRSKAAKGERLHCNSFHRYRSESQTGRRRDKTFGRGERGAACWQGYPRAKGQDGAGGAGVGYPHVSDTACPGASRPCRSTVPLPGHDSG